MLSKRINFYKEFYHLSKKSIQFKYFYFDKQVDNIELIGYLKLTGILSDEKYNNGHVFGEIKYYGYSMRGIYYRTISSVGVF